MRWQLAAAGLELAGNATLVVALIVVGRHPWPSIALKQLAAAAAVYASTNVFYSIAYVGRLLERFEWWDTPVESFVEVVQVGSMWALLVTGIESVVAAHD